MTVFSCFFNHRLVGGRIVLLHVHNLPDSVTDLFFGHTGPQIFRADDWTITFGWHGGNLQEVSGVVTRFDGSGSELLENRWAECNLHSDPSVPGGLTPCFALVRRPQPSLVFPLCSPAAMKPKAWIVDAL